jgi:sirohydrochlorin ferrochelatase
MKALLLVAHGSRLVSSNDAIKQLTVKLRDKLSSSGFMGVEHAFLELTEPSIPDGIATLIDQGANDVIVLPYFLAPGTHVVDDVPELIEAARIQYPEATFTVMTHLGAVDGMVELILSSADTTV